MKFSFGVTLAVLASALIVSYVQQSEAAPSSWMGFYCFKNYIASLVHDKLLGRSTLVRHYEETNSQINKRFQEAKLNGELNGKNDQEQENFYYKIVVEELRKLKLKIESGEIQENNAHLDADTEKSVSDCFDPDAMVENWNPDSDSMDQEAESQLLLQLETLEKEEEMGWALTDEARQQLQARTKMVLVDLINNEVRQLGMALLAAYLSGGSVMPALMTLSAPIRHKLAEFFLNTIVDLVSHALGRKIEITSMVHSAPVGAEVAPMPSPLNNQPIV